MFVPGFTRQLKLSYQNVFHHMFLLHMVV